MKSTARELTKHNFDSINMHFVRWTRLTWSQKTINFFVEKGMRIIICGRFFIHRRIIQRIAFMRN
jgi:hypothetical protein